MKKLLLGVGLSWRTEYFEPVSVLVALIKQDDLCE